MGGRAQSKAQQSNYDHQKAFIYQALQQLSPENISQLMQAFLPHIMAAQAPIAQTALHTLQRTQAQKGIAGSRISGSQQLGLQSSLANQAQQQAFQQAFGLAGQRAGVWGQQPSQAAPNYNLTNGLQQGFQQAILAAALQGHGQKQQATPYDASGAPWTRPGWNPEPVWGLPSSYEPRMY